MLLTNSILSAIQILGTTQGLILAGWLFFRGKGRGQKWLAVFLALLAFSVLSLTVLSADLLLRFPWLLILMDGLPFLFGPLTYRYLRDAIVGDALPPSPLWPQLVPAAANAMFYAVLIAVQGIAGTRMLVELAFTGSPLWFVAIWDLGKFASGAIYTVLAFRLLGQWRNRISKWTDASRHVRWFHFLLIVLASCWALVILSGLLVMAVRWSPGYFAVVVILRVVAYTAVFYALTFFAMRHPVILEPKLARKAIGQRLGLGPAEVRSILLDLDKALEDSEFREQATLGSAASRLGIHPNALSYAVNEKTQGNFSAYVNRRRLEAFMRLADFQDQSSRRTLLDLAFEAGFPSKSTFLRVFKDQYGTTPRVYLAKESE